MLLVGPDQTPSQPSEQPLWSTMKDIISPAKSPFSLQMQLQAVTEGNNIKSTGSCSQSDCYLAKKVNYYSSLASKIQINTRTYDCRHQNTPFIVTEKAVQ